MPTLGEVRGFILEDHPDVCLIQASGRFDQTNLFVLAQEIDPFIRNDTVSYIILDFTKVEFINSKILAYLADLHSSMREHKKIVLGGCSEFVLNILTLVGLHTILHYFESTEEALKVIISDREQ